MSKLSDLEAALETYRHKVTMLRGELGAHFIPTRIRERDIARERLAELLIEAAPALLAVARAAEGPAAEYELGGRYDGDATYPDLAAALAPLVEEADCPACHGHGGGGGFDRNGSHTEGRYCEYPCPTCGKEADDE